MKITFDTATNVLVVAVCVIVTVVVLNRDQSVNSSAQLPPTYAIGDVPAFYGDLPSASSHIVAFVRSSCRFCTDSMPFYRLLAERTAALSGIRFTVLGDEPLDKLREYAAAHGLENASMVSISRHDPHLVMTPALFMIDADGSVTGVWRGRLGPEAETEVMSHLR